MEYKLELYHHGTKGMRWGIRRYQNKDGSLTPAGKKRYNKEMEKLRAEEKTLKNKAATQKKLQKLEDKRAKVDALKKGSTSDEAEAKAKAEAHEQARQKAVQSGSASELLKFKGELTSQEMQAAWSRIQWEQNMSSIAEKEVVTGKRRLGKFFDKVDNAVKYAGTAAKTWNTIANVYNAFNKKGVVLPKIETDVSKGNKKDVDAFKKAKQKAEEAAKKRAEQEAQRETKQKERAEKRAKTTEETEKVERVDAEFIGNKNDWKKNTKAGESKVNETINSDFWKDTSVSDVPDQYVALGRSTVAGLLEEP